MSVRLIKDSAWTVVEHDGDPETPGGVLCGGHTPGAHGGVALSHGCTGNRVRGAVSRARPLVAQRRGKLGVQGGRSVPCQAAVLNTASAELVRPESRQEIV